MSRIELGHAGDITARTLDAIATALSARFDLSLNWNGEALDRLLDADHASIVEFVAGTLRRLDWEVAVEVSFNIRGERGSIDILAFHRLTGTILLVEVKSVVPDIQATLFVLDRKTRLAAQVARERGWVARGVGRLLVVRGTRTNRRKVAAHGETFEAAFPGRALEIRRWIRDPIASSPISGLCFVPDDRSTSARHPRVWPNSRTAERGRPDRSPDFVTGAAVAVT